MTKYQEVVIPMADICTAKEFDLSDASYQLKPLAVGVTDCCRMTSLKRTSVFKLIKIGQLETCRVNRRTLILVRSIETLLGLNEGQR